MKNSVIKSTIFKIIFWTIFGIWFVTSILCLLIDVLTFKDVIITNVIVFVISWTISYIISFIPCRIIQVKQSKKENSNDINDINKQDWGKKLRSNKRFKTISLERKIQLENYMKELKQNTKLSAFVPKMENSLSTIFSSKYGGTPYWDLSKDYPKDSEGNKLYMLAQINLEDKNLEESNLPKKGILQFFVGTDDKIGLNYYNPDSQIDWRIVYHSEINKSIKEEDILKLNLPKLDLFDESSPYTFNKADDMIQNRNYNYSEKQDEIIKEKLNGIEQEYLDECIQNFESPSDKLLGYPLFWQDDPRNEKKFQRYDTLLFQYSTGTDIVLFFFINHDDLKNGDFSKVLYWWDK